MKLFHSQRISSLLPRKPRSIEKKIAIQDCVYDSVQCTHYVQITEAHFHTPLVMQTILNVVIHYSLKKFKVI